MASLNAVKAGAFSKMSVSLEGGKMSPPELHVLLAYGEHHGRR